MFPVADVEKIGSNVSRRNPAGSSLMEISVERNGMRAGFFFKLSFKSLKEKNNGSLLSYLCYIHPLTHKHHLKALDVPRTIACQRCSFDISRYHGLH